MDNIFDNIGKKASEAYKFTADKTEKIAKETRIKFKMNDLKNQVDDLYKQIGKKIYEKRIREEKIEIKDELEELCKKIDVLNDEIEKLRKESLELKDRKQCQSCYTEIEKNDKYCKQCGAKQLEEEIKENEEIENDENTIIENEESENIEQDENKDNTEN